MTAVVVLLGTLLLAGLFVWLEAGHGCAPGCARCEDGRGGRVEE